MEPNSLVDTKAVLAHHGRVMEFLLGYVSRTAYGPTAIEAADKIEELAKLQAVPVPPVKGEDHPPSIDLQSPEYDPAKSSLGSEQLKDSGKLHPGNGKLGAA